MVKEELKNKIAKFLEGKTNVEITCGYMEENPMVGDPMEHEIWKYIGNETEEEKEKMVEEIVNYLYDIDFGSSTIDFYDWEKEEYLDFEPIYIVGKRKKYLVSYDNGFRFDTIATLEEAMQEAVAKHGYNAGGITISGYYDHKDYAFAQFWGVSYNPEEEEKPLADYGKFGYLSAWVVID